MGAYEFLGKLRGFIYGGHTSAIIQPRGNPSTTERDQMLVQSKRNTWGALGEVQIVLKEMVFGDLADELTDAEFEKVELAYDQISKILEVN